MLGDPKLNKILVNIIIVIIIIFIMMMDERYLRGDEDEDMLSDPKLDVGDLEEAGHEHLKLVRLQESEDHDDIGGGDLIEG